MSQPYGGKTTFFVIAVAVENHFDTIIELFHNEIDDNTEQYFSKHEALLNDNKKISAQ